MTGVPRSPLTPPKPRRGEIWWVDPDPVRGPEQGGRRPAVVVSVDGLNLGRSGLVVVCPLTTSLRPNRLHLVLDPPEAGLAQRSVVLIEHVRSISTERLGRRIGRVSPVTAEAIDDRLRRLFGSGAARVRQLT